MARWGWWLAGAVLVFGVYSCDDEPTKPLAGAGLRFVFPEGADTLEGLRVALLDPDQTFPNPDCGQMAQDSRSPLPQTIGECDSTQLSITNLIREEVRRWSCPTPPETTCTSLFWDGTDEDGNPVPGGYYFLNIRCFQPDSIVSLEKGVYVAAGPEDVCDWPLWSEEVPSVPADRTLEVAPFPIEIPHDVGSEPVDTIRFMNPYVVRVHASGMQVFEQEITLVEGKYTDVAVTFTPLETP